MIKTLYLIRCSSPFVEINNYNDYENVLWNEYSKNMILSIQGGANGKDKQRIRFNKRI